VDICVCSLIARERIKQFAPNLACLCLETRKMFQKGQNSESVLSSSLCEGGFCSSVTKHDRRSEPEQTYFGGNITGAELQIRKRSWVRVPVKMLGLGIGLTIFSYDIQRYVSNDQVYDKLLGIKIYMKCKHLPNFPAASLRALC
jgi:hypothetical protein